MINSNIVYEYFNNLQINIVETLQLVDGKNFINDSWQRKEGGGGTSCILKNGNVFERAGVGFSHVLGDICHTQQVLLIQKQQIESGRLWVFHLSYTLKIHMPLQCI